MAYVFFANEAWHIQNFYENEALHFFRGPRPGGAGAEFGRQPTSQWGHFFPTSALNIARTFHTATLLTNGQVLMARGSGASNALASVELFAPASAT